MGQSRARRYDPGSAKRTTLADVADIEDVKNEVMEIVDYLHDPGRYSRLGAQIPRGVLLSGQPGTGKTLLARAIAGEADVPFFSISASEFVEMIVGVGASWVVLAATNRPEILDAALLRPGRLDRRVTVSAPDQRGRRQILAVHTRGVPLAAGVDLDALAAATPAWSART